MNMLKRFLAFVLVAAMLVTMSACSLFRNFDENQNGEENVKDKDDPYSGHYLIDIYDPYDGTRDHYYHEELVGNIYEIEEFTMANETFKKGIYFGESFDDKDLYLDYDIGGKYKSISFFYGMDSSVRFQCDFNVSFQVIDAETERIIWEDLFRAGDIPRFATVDITGINKLRLECYNLERDSFCMGNITLWEGESEAVDRSYERITEPTYLEDNYKFYHSLKTWTMTATSWMQYHNFSNCYDKLSIKGRKFDHAASLMFNDDLVMNLRGQFKQVSFTWGISDQKASFRDDFVGYMSIYADGVCVLDEFKCTVDTPEQTIILDVNYAWQLRFVLRSDQGYCPYFVLAELRGGEKLGEPSGPVNDGNTPMPLIRTHYPHVTAGTGMGTYVKIYDSSSRYHGFYMAGEKYIEGIVLAPVFNPLSSTTSPAYAVSDLEGKYKYVTFTAGHIDTAAYKEALLEIYIDGEEIPSYTFTIKDTDMPKDYTVEVRNCHSIKFLVKGAPNQDLPLVGIANLVCYPETVVENNIFTPFYTDYPESCEMVDYFTPFGYASYGLDKIYYNDGIYADGKYFETFDGVEHKKGLLFCTQTGMDWSHVGFMDLAAGWGLAAVSSTQNPVVEQNSFFIFNIGGQYDKLTFKTAEAVGSNTGEFGMLLGDPPQEGEQTIKIYGDDDQNPIYSCDLVDGTVQEHTVDVSGVTRLIFCVPNNSTIMSKIYAAYDVMLEKNSN